jgi:hypothetical protein
MTQMAAGNMPRLPEDPAQSDRDIAGPRFIQID